MCIYRGARASAGKDDDAGMYLVRIAEFGFSSSGTHVVQSGCTQHYIYISLSIYTYISMHMWMSIIDSRACRERARTCLYRSFV